MTKEYKQERAAFEAWMADNEVRMHHAHLNHEEEMREAYFAGMKQARAAMAAAPVQVVADSITVNLMRLVGLDKHR